MGRTIDIVNHFLSLLDLRIDSNQIGDRIRQSKTKFEASIEFRKYILGQYEQWFLGELDILYGERPPQNNQKIYIGSLRENSIATWAKVHQENKYLDALILNKDVFKGMRVLDVGAGPIPSALVFDECEIYCLDPLLPEFHYLGYPFWSYSHRAKFVYGFSEKMPFPDDFFDAVISVNALDHVNDFNKTAQEIIRVSKSSAKLRFHLHYHPPSKLEPISLTDKIVMEAFKGCDNFQKISESKSVRGTQLSNQELFTVWSNFP